MMISRNITRKGRNRDKQMFRKDFYCLTETLVIAPISLKCLLSMRWDSGPDLGRFRVRVW